MIVPNSLWDFGNRESYPTANWHYKMCSSSYMVGIKKNPYAVVKANHDLFHSCEVLFCN